jgi:hypothetical protein
MQPARPSHADTEVRGVLLDVRGVADLRGGPVVRLVYPGSV